ncbi:hypothetical protein ACVTMO_02555 [Pseudomonas segetis]|uniref:Type IV pili methyl-accepting chemotaxis transducer N-term n=1 Tax=Pseudomonas segetis TaxID=298908 RepID=A0A239INH6_9PSED|nr:hypothetical protein [Pseudomonas segetis]SNS94798.1 hypothetical protein SAMN05216255_3960 [Pseudomonas segetis]
MRSKLMITHAFIFLIALAASFPASTSAAALSPAELAQVYACRATSSLLLLRGEGFQKIHQQRLEADLQALNGALQAISQPSDNLLATRQELVTQLRNGVSYGPSEDNVPWRYPQELSKALRDFLHEARQMPQGSDDELPAEVEYLAVQYLSRSYMGTFEIAREQPDTYLGQDERLLLPKIDQQLNTAGLADDPALGKLTARWEYLKSALADMNSKSNTLQSVSGRPFAPITVDRHSRTLTQNWIEREQASPAVAAQ